MLRSVIKVGEYSSRLLRDNGCFVVLSRKFADGIQRIKYHDGDKLDFITDIAAKQLYLTLPTLL